jgi:hypothetical protein
MDKMKSTRDRLKNLSEKIENMKKSGVHTELTKNADKLFGKILNHGGGRYESIVTSKFLDLMCIPYLEDITESMTSPKEFTGK